MLLSQSIVTIIYGIWLYSEQRRSAARSPVLVFNTKLGIAKEDKMNWNTLT